MKSKWVQLTQELLVPIQKASVSAVASLQIGDNDLRAACCCAQEHLFDCLRFSNMAKDASRYAVSLCLLRQCLEALNVVELGLDGREPAVRMLGAWRKGSVQAGDVRKFLQRETWTKYGSGLWEETWSEFFEKLARALQPYAHYTGGLMQWQWALTFPDPKDKLGLGSPVNITVGGVDETKYARMTLLHSLVVWCWGRVLIAADRISSIELVDSVRRLGGELGGSKLLSKKNNWEDELFPGLLMLSENWIDD